MKIIINENQLKNLFENSDSDEKSVSTVSNFVLRFYDLIITSDYEESNRHFNDNIYNILVKIGFWPKKNSSITPEKKIFTAHYTYYQEKNKLIQEDFLYYLNEIGILKIISGEKPFRKFIYDAADKEANLVVKKINRERPIQD